MKINYKKIRELRKEKDLCQYELAEKADCSDDLIQLLESEVHDYTTNVITFSKIAQVLGVWVEDLLIAEKGDYDGK